MLDQLQVNQGKTMVVELVNGRKISGTLIAVNPQYVRMDTEEGVGTIPLKSIQVCWENVARSVNEENMEYLAKQLRSTEESRINCTAVPGFTCVNQYICIPPDNCVYTFACPGRYSPGAPQGGCGFQFYQPCGFPFFFVPCGVRFTQPCYFRFIPPCGPFQFQQPCGPFQFQQPCGPFQFQQPCFFPFGSQCPTPGGFVCPGQAFIGIVGPTEEHKVK